MPVAELAFRDVLEELPDHEVAILIVEDGPERYLFATKSPLGITWAWVHSFKHPTPEKDGPLMTWNPPGKRADEIVATRDVDPVWEQFLLNPYILMAVIMLE